MLTHSVNMFPLCSAGKIMQIIDLVIGRQQYVIFFSCSQPQIIPDKKSHCF
jgi:hypothetical protein